MKKTHLYLSAFLIVLLGFKDDTMFETYCNDRFHFCINYPKDFTGQGEPTNGDGQVFISKDSMTEIRGYGMLANDFKLTEEYEISVKEIAVSYKVIKNSWYIFSGVDKAGKFVYQKTVKKKINYFNDDFEDVFYTLSISYPSSQQAVYKAYCDTIAKSL